MTLRRISEILDAQVLAGKESSSAEVVAGCGCDLMSDVLAFIKPGALLLTGLNNQQAVRTAEMADIKAICFVRGKQPNKELLSLAREKGMVIMATPLPLFEACGKLYQNGLKGCSDDDRKS